MIKVSVIIPVFNTSPSELKCCLNSVLNQDIDNYEVIIVDDGSDEDEDRVRILAEFSIKNHFTLITHKENKGLPVARNTGLSAAVGEYIIHLDSDDFWVSNSVLSILYNTALIDKCDILRFNGWFFIDGEYEERLVSDKEVINQSLDCCHYLAVFRSVFLYLFKSSFVFSNELYFHPSINLGEDAVYLSKALTVSKKISTINELLYAYRVDNESMTRSVWGIENLIDENNAANEVIYNIREYPNVLSSYIINRYIKYFSFQLLIRSLLLSKDEFNSIIKVYSDTYYKVDNILENGVISEAKFYNKVLLSLVLLVLKRYGIFYLLLKNIYAPILTLRYKHARNLKKQKALKLLIKKAVSYISRSRPNVFPSYQIDNNQENIQDYTLKCKNKKNLKKGLSVLLRVKNEGYNIRRSIESIIESATEITLVDNNSSDNTVQIVQSLMDNHPQGYKIKLYHYPFLISRCGSEHNSTPENSVHSLAYYYNWCVSQCNFNTIIKWDADMVFINDQEIKKLFNEQIKAVSNTRFLVSIKINAQTVYMLNGKKGLKSLKEVNSEQRIFSNSKYVVFKKAENFEEITFLRPYKSSEITLPCAYELKYLATDEYSHWSEKKFNTNRKTKEYRNFVALRDGVLHPRQYKNFTEISFYQDKNHPQA